MTSNLPLNLTNSYRIEDVQGVAVHDVKEAVLAIAPEPGRRSEVVDHDAARADVLLDADLCNFRLGDEHAQHNAVVLGRRPDNISCLHLIDNAI